MSKGSKPRTYNKQSSDRYRNNKYWDKDNIKSSGKKLMDRLSDTQEKIAIKAWNEHKESKSND